VAEHTLVAPGEGSVRDEHYGGPPTKISDQAAPITSPGRLCRLQYATWGHQHPLADHHHRAVG
jgi:hypothetical protein